MTAATPGFRLTHCDFPRTASEFLRCSEMFRAELQALKHSLHVPDYGWYPYETLSALGILTKLIEPVFEEVARPSHRVQSPISGARTGIWGSSAHTSAGRWT